MLSGLLHSSVRQHASAGVLSLLQRTASCGGVRKLSQATAQVLRFGENGQPKDVLSLQTEELPAVGPGQIMVEMLAAPINPSDINTIEGKYPTKLTMPAVPGNEGVGVVKMAGKGAAHKVGDRVVPLCPGEGTWRSAGVFDSSRWYRIENGIPTATAATLSINPATAVAMLEDVVDLQKDDVIVQNGANSAVGKAVIEYARCRGWRTLNVIRDRPDWDAEVASLKSLGANVVTTAAGVRDAARAMNKRPVLGLNCVGGKAAAAIAKTLQPGSTLITYGGMSMQPVSLPTSLFIFKDLRAVGFWLSGTWAKDKGPSGKAELMDRMLPYVNAHGIFRPDFREFDLADYDQALLWNETPYRKQKAMFRWNDALGSNGHWLA